MDSMTSLLEPTTLGRTGLTVGRLGLSSSYGMPAAAVERAFEAGMNYLYWGSVRREAFAIALRNLRPRRDRMVLVLQSYSRVGFLVTRGVERTLARLGYDHADVLLLGWWSGRPWSNVLAAARGLRQRGLVKHLAISTHNRPLIPRLATDPDIDLFHVRYNAVHCGAERDVFPHLPAENRPGLVAFTTTCWRKLLDPKRVPASERTPTAGDCYRFALAQPAIDVCMTGLGSMEHTEQALAALQKGPMSAEELAWMRRVGDAIYGQRRGAETG